MVITFGDKTIQSRFEQEWQPMGKIGEIRESDVQYVERLEQYFLVNEVKDAGKERAILLSVCGSKTYALGRDAPQPARPAETTFKKIVKTLEKHFALRPSKIVEHFKFHSRNQNKGEGVVACVAELRKHGINDKKIQ